MATRDERLIKFAYKKALESTHHTQKIAAVLACGPRIINVGINIKKTHAQQSRRRAALGTYGCSIHAEVNAILPFLNEDLSDFTLYVARRLKNGDVGMARPCVVCQKMISDHKIKKVVYTIGRINSDVFKFEMGIIK